MTVFALVLLPVVLLLLGLPVFLALLAAAAASLYLVLPVPGPALHQVLFGGLDNYALLAIPLRSYFQPLLIMSVIPFGLVGAIGGHLIMGRGLSFMSVQGIIALSGVVVNSSLVLVHYVNEQRAKGTSLEQAVVESGCVRFRPILLTSLTTFAGLTPLLLETSTQAQFLIPMAISLAFGVMFASAITLFIVPSGYLVLEDAKLLPASVRERVRRWRRRDREATFPAAGP